MDTYVLSLAMIGLIGLSISWVPSLARKVSISYSVFYLLLGFIAYLTLNDLPWPNPFRQQTYTVHLTELIVIIAIMSTGLRIDRKLKFKLWRVPLRLIFLLMPISIFSLAALGYWGLGLGAASALLLGAVMAPTDPVLAADVQVGPPNSSEEAEIKLALTAEAGMNDGMAFPFTYLAIGLALAAQTGQPWFWKWITVDVFYAILSGGVIGYLLGRVIAYLFFELPKQAEMSHVQDGMVALSTTLLVYGITELFNGYGFIAVFVAAVTIRNSDRKARYHKKLHEFIDQVERILLGTLLLLFGGSIVGGILEPLTWKMAVVGILFVLLIRPLSTLLCLVGVPINIKEKLAIGFFGIKGIGSFYYLAYALSKAEFAFEEELWALASFIVLVSVLVHGLTAIPILGSEKFKSLRSKPL